MLTPEPTGGVIWNANRGAISLRVTTHGKAAHVGRQFEGVKAFERALPAITRLVDIKKEVELRETKQNIAPAAARKSILMLGGRVEAGTNFNVTPDFCSFTVERRINPPRGVTRALLSAFAQQLHGTVIVSLHVSHPDGESFGHAGVGVNREKERAGDRTVRS